MNRKTNGASALSYEVIGSLGQGMLGVLHLACWRQPSGLWRRCVIKHVRRTLALDPRFRDVCAAIVRRMMSMAHPNVASVFDVGQEHDQYFLVMDYLDGQPVEAIVMAAEQSAYQVDVAVWARVIADALRGMHYVHQQTRLEFGVPLVHGCVGPRDIFVTYEGRVVTMGFGSWELMEAARRIDTEVVTPRGFTAPEVHDGQVPDERADVYAAGMTLRTLIARSCTRGSASMLLRLEAIVQRATRTRVDQRYPTALAMAEALETSLASSEGLVCTDSLAGLVGTFFDEERKRARDRMRDRSGDHVFDDGEDAMLVTLFSQQAPRPKLELVFSDEGDGVDPSEDVDVECLSSSDFEAVSLSSSALQSEPSAAVLTFDPADVEQSEANELAEVSIVPDGEITAPGIVVFDDVPSSVGRLGEVEGEGEGKEILQGTHVPTDALIRAVAPWSGRPSSQDGEEFDRPTPPASLDRAMARVIAERYKTCVQFAEEPKGCHEGCQEEGKMSGEEENPVSLVFLSKPVRKKDEDRVTGQERIDGAVTDRREGPETSPMNT